MNPQTIELMKDFYNFFILPLFVWIWFTDRKVNKLEVTVIKVADLKDLYDKLQEIKDNIHALNDKFTSVKTCDIRHTKTT
ncbi:MAG: hypothetical protein PHG81_12945 [Aliarcobacter sp.]|nr:hypothetical protein [Aliarcobacter sp.]